MKKLVLILVILLTFLPLQSETAQWIKADTAVKVLIGPFVDVGDGFTPETGITLGAADEAELLKHEANAVTDISALVWTAMTTADGYYNLDLTGSETDTEGMLTVLVHDDSVCLPVVVSFMVTNAKWYDALFTNAGDRVEVDIKEVGSDAITDNADGRLEVNVEEIADVAVSPTTAHLGVNAVQISANTTAADDVESYISNIYASVGSIYTDTDAQDTSAELRTLLTGADVAVSVLSTSHTIGINLDNLVGTLDASEIGADALTDAKVADDVKVDTNTILASSPSLIINTEVVDVLKTDTVSEMAQGGPSATPSMEDILNYLYRGFRNKVITSSSTVVYYDDAGTAILFKCTISDDGVIFTRGEMATGP